MSQRLGPSHTGSRFTPADRVVVVNGANATNVDFNGALTLYDDGSFVYTPTLNFVGTDTFSYQGSDSLDESNWGAVTIQVTHWH